MMMILAWNLIWLVILFKAGRDFDRLHLRRCRGRGWALNRERFSFPPAEKTALTRFGYYLVIDLIGNALLPLLRVLATNG